MYSIKSICELGGLYTGSVHTVYNPFRTVHCVCVKSVYTKNFAKMQEIT